MPKTIDQFDNERKEILNKILKILEITDVNKMISLKKLDEDIDKQNKILELVPDIKKYFICSKWNFFINKKRESNRNHVSLLKSIMKDMNINMISTVIMKKIDGKNKSETNYVFVI